MAERRASLRYGGKSIVTGEILVENAAVIRILEINPSSVVIEATVGNEPPEKMELVVHDYFSAHLKMPLHP